MRLPALPNVTLSLWRLQVAGPCDLAPRWCLATSALVEAHEGIETIPL